MVGPTDVVQPPVARAARARDACLWHVSSVGGARRRGCAAAGVPGFFSGLLARLDRQDVLEDLVGVPSALRFLELLVVPAVVQLGPWDA
jgi:hypothetical protein